MVRRERETTLQSDTAYTVQKIDTRDYIIDMSEELARLAAKSGLDELESILRLAKLTARQPADDI